MPWIDDVAAVLVVWFGGQEVAGALVDILTGESDPGGRLPITFPKRLEDTPAWEHYLPTDGRQEYTEGLAMGYRGFDAAGIDPLFAFGHGLSYGETSWGQAEVLGGPAEISAADPTGSVTVSVPVRNTGARSATVVVQGYVAQPEAVRVIPKALKTWKKVVVAAGELETVSLEFGTEMFRRWDPAAAGGPAWAIASGTAEVVIARSAADEHQRLSIELSQ